MLPESGCLLGLDFVGCLNRGLLGDLMEFYLKALRIDIDLADELKADSIAALSAAGKDFVRQQRDFVRQPMFVMVDTINPAPRNFQASPMADSAHP